MRIVFMGTPDFAATALEALSGTEHEIVLVVTQPDKPKGRGKEMQMPPVKECALLHNYPVFQPDKIKTAESVEILRQYHADVFVVAAFGQILSEEILTMPPFGCINIHASLLPKYRGAAPIQWSILEGEKETGVTIMQMDRGIDTGDMLLKRAIPILDTDTGESLFDKLSILGGELIVEALPLLEAGKLVPEKQEEEQSCYAKMLSKSLGRIDWTVDAASIERKVRALNSWPSAYTTRDGKQIKIWKSRVGELSLAESASDASISEAKPGQIVAVKKESIAIQTGDGVLELLEVQPEGKKRMPVQAYLLGYPAAVGAFFGE